MLTFDLTYLYQILRSMGSEERRGRKGGRGKEIEMEEEKTISKTDGGPVRKKGKSDGDGEPGGRTCVRGGEKRGKRR